MLLRVRSVFKPFIYDLPRRLVTKAGPSLKKRRRWTDRNRREGTCKLFPLFRCWELSMWVLAGLAFILHDALFWEKCIVTRGMLAFFIPEGARLLHSLYLWISLEFVTSDLNYAYFLFVCLFVWWFWVFFLFFSFILFFFFGKPSDLWIFYIHNIL